MHSWIGTRAGDVMDRKSMAFWLKFGMQYVYGVLKSSLQFPYQLARLHTVLGHKLQKKLSRCHESLERQVVKYIIR